MTNVQLSEDEISEFRTEAEELLDQAEQSLLEIDKGSTFAKGYDAIFRAFHNVKGAAGMLNWDTLQQHMHQLETHFQNCKEEETLSKKRVSYFLNGIDSCRKILSGQNIAFTYELPSDTSDASPLPQTSSSQSKPDIKTINKLLVFVIDDEPDIVEILSDVLEAGGYQVRGFSNPMEAIQSIDTLKPQTILTDMSMPKMTGFDVLKLVYEKDPDLPVIFVSAHLSKKILIEALEFGVFGAIEKPFNESQILNICKIATKRYQLWSLLNRSINFVLYQYSGLEDYLISKGMFEVKDLMVKEMQALLDVRRQLREAKTED